MRFKTWINFLQTNFKKIKMFLIYMIIVNIFKILWILKIKI